MRYRMAESVDFLNSRYFIINKRLQNVAGLWPYQSITTSYAIRSFIIFLIIVSIVPQVITLHTYATKDIDKAIRALTTAVYLIGILLKFVTAILANRHVKIIYKNIAKNWHMLEDEIEKTVLYEYSEVGRTMTIGYMAYMLITMFSFIGMPYVPIILDKFVPINGTRPRLYVLDGEYFIDKDEYYYRIFFCESLVPLVTTPLLCVVDTTYTVCVQQCIALLAIVKLRLKLTTKPGEQKYLKTLKKKDVHNLVIKSIELHQKVLNFGKVLETSYSASFLVYVLMSILAISVGTLVILANLSNPYETFRFSMVFIGVVIHLVFISWPGQQLIDCSSNIGFDAYNNEWYEYSLDTQKLLYTMSQKCMKPCELTAGGFYIMNIQNFGKLVKSSLSYLAVFVSLK